LLVTSAVAAPRAADWPQWRGPARDGAAAGFEEPASWPDSLTRQWTADLGLGYATPLLVGGRLLFLLKDDGRLVGARESLDGLVFVREYTVSDGSTWAQPVVDGRRVFIKDKSIVAS
jgi:hypothetical protein